MSLFKKRIAYKPFEYPEYYTEGWLKQAQAFWLHTEIPMSGDVKDWNEKLTSSEKNLVGNILLGFAQTECAVSDYWTQKVVAWFPKHEIQQMAMIFGSQETVTTEAGGRVGVSRAGVREQGRGQSKYPEQNALAFCSGYLL